MKNSLILLSLSRVADCGNNIDNVPHEVTALTGNIVNCTPWGNGIEVHPKAMALLVPPLMALMMPSMAMVLQCALRQLH